MGQGFGLVSLCLERILGDFVPNTVSEGRLGLGQDNFNFFVDSPTLGQIPGSNLLETVGVGWVGLDDFNLVVDGSTLGR